jgi:hypothetical protein
MLHQEHRARFIVTGRELWWQLVDLEDIQRDRAVCYHFLTRFWGRYPILRSRSIADNGIK